MFRLRKHTNKTNLYGSNGLVKSAKKSVRSVSFRKQRLLIITTITIFLSGLVYASLLLTRPASASWYNDSWAYRKKIPITAHTGSETNVYISLPINTADTNRFQSDCGDIRFTKSDNTLLPYYIVSGCGTSSTMIHVNFDTFPAGAQNIYIYYGNPYAANGFEASDFSTAATNYTLGSYGNEEKVKQPILYYGFDEGYGTTTYDSMSAKNNGSITNATWQTEDLCITGKCLYFNGSTATVSASLATNNVQTVGFWIKPKTNGESIVDFDGGTHTITASGGVISATGFSNPTIYVNGQPSKTLTANTWQHIEVTTSTAFNATTLKIGKVSSTYLNGFIDEFKIYDYVRRASEIKTDAVRGAAPAGSEAVMGASSTDPLNQGLVGYWKMDDPGITSEGQTTTDSSGNSNSFTLYGDNGSGDNGSGMDCTAAGKFGTGCNFDGADDNLKNTVADFRSADHQGTITAWVKPTNFNSSRYIFGSGDNGSTNRIFDVGISSTVPGAIFIEQQNAKTINAVRSVNTLTAGEWNHVAFISDGSQYYLYINGIQQDYNVTSGINNGDWLADVAYRDNITIGNLDYSPTPIRYFLGNIDEVRVYNRALSPAEVQQLYNWAPGPVGWWKLDESSGNAVDSSGNNYTLATSQTNVGRVAGKYGSAVDFEKDTPFTMTIADNAQLSITGSLTLAAWIKPESITASTAFPITGKWDSATSYLLSQYGDEIRFSLNSDSNYVETNSLNLEVGKWYYVEAVYKASLQQVEIFVNGVKQTTSTTGTIPSSVNDNTSNYFVGGYNSQNSGSFSGNITASGNDTMYCASCVPVLNATYNTISIGRWTSAYSFANTLRYVNVTIPQGATITNAYLKFYAYEANSGTTANGKIAADDVDNATAPTTEAQYNALVARLTTAQVNWNNIGSWSDFGVAYNSPDIKDVVQEVVNRSGWVSGNSMQLWVGDNNSTDWAIRRAISYNSLGSSTNTPELHADYQTGTMASYDGVIDNVKVYNYARTPAQIAEDMQGDAPAAMSPLPQPVVSYNFDEGYGDTAHNTGSAGSVDNGNLAGSGNTCPTTGSCPTWSNTGKFGKALDFDGTDDYVNAGSDTGLDNVFAAGGTVATWIKLDSFGQGNLGRIIDKTNYLNLGVSNNGTYGTNTLLFFRAFSSNNGYWSTPNNSLTTEIWTHVAVTYNENSSTNDPIMYINGVRVPVTEITGYTPNGSASSDAAGELYIGNRYNAASYDRTFDGIIDDLKIYRWELTADQVKVLYNQGQSQVMGSVSTSSDGKTPDFSASRQFCVPGDSSACSAPVGEWRFNESTDQDVNDTSGNNNTGQLGNDGYHVDTNDPAWIAGKVGSALSFDNNDDYVYVYSNNGLDNLAQITVEAWIYPKSLGKNGASRIYQKGTASPSQNIQGLYVYTNNSLRFMYGWSTSINYFAAWTTPDNSLTLNRWNHVTVSYNRASTGNDPSIYVNGILQSLTENTSPSGSAGNDTGPIFIGNRNGADRPFDGYIDEVRYYDYNRTPAQIAWDYNQGAPLAYYNFDECTGATLHNTALNANGTAAGMNGTIIPNTGRSTGTCGSGTSTEMWNGGTNGKYSGSLYFDGSGDYVTTPSLGNFLPTAFTISAWIYRTGNAADSGIAGQWKSNEGYMLWLNGNQASFPINSSPHLNSGYTVPLDTWTHLTGTFDGTTANIYINGQLKASQSESVPAFLSPPAFEIGRYGETGGTYFLGQIDDVRLYNYALTPVQVKTLYNNDSAVSF